VFEGASAQGDFTVSWAAPGTPGREAEGGCARSKGRSKATRSEGDDLGDIYCLLEFVRCVLGDDWDVYYGDGAADAP